MSVVHVHVDRVVVEGGAIHPRDAAALADALADELVRQLEGTSPPATAVGSVQAPPVTTADWGSPGALGRAAATALADAVREVGR